MIYKSVCRIMKRRWSRYTVWLKVYHLILKDFLPVQVVYSCVVLCYYCSNSFIVDETREKRAVVVAAVAVVGGLIVLGTVIRNAWLSTKNTNDIDEIKSMVKKSLSNSTCTSLFLHFHSMTHMDKDSSECAECTTPNSDTPLHQHHQHQKVIK